MVCIIYLVVPEDQEAQVDQVFHVHQRHHQNLIDLKKKEKHMVKCKYP